MKLRFQARLSVVTLAILASGLSSAQALAAMKAVRGSVLHFVADPFLTPEAESYRYFEDGAILLDNGKVVAAGPAAEVLAKAPAGTPTQVYKDSLIVPGFIDTHIHYPQTEMIASYGEQLLEWLDKYTFPTERKFADKKHARGVAKFFLKQLLSSGTTTALVFGTVHKASVDAFFEEAQKLDLRMIAGKVLMDRNAPEYLRDTPQSAYDDSKELIQKWHNKGRLLYAITPRFAITSTDEQLAKAGQLKKEFPDTYVHTHLSENRKEIEFTLSLFPKNKSYLDVYDGVGLLSSRSVFAHGVHVNEAEMQRLSETGSAISFCATSNLFLGSGLFPLETAKDPKRPVKVALGTDVGAGTSFSILETMNESYKIQQLQGKKLSAFKAFYLATLGGARALELQDKIGNFEKGKEADFVVLDKKATPLMSYRMKNTQDLAETLFVLMTLGDDRAVKATYVNGEIAYKKK